MQEVIETPAYSKVSNIDEAESVLRNALENESTIKLNQVLIIKQIRDNELYKDRLDPETGKPFPTMAAYWKYITMHWHKLGPGRVSNIKTWITKVDVFVEQLGWDKDKLLEMGMHSNILLPAANKARIGAELLDEDKDIPETGGKKLGKDKFIKLSEEIYEKVSRNPYTPPEQQWLVTDTLDYVNGLLGKKLHPKKEWKAEHVGDKIRVKELTIWYDDFAHTFVPTGGDIVSTETFAAICPKTDKVTGLNEDWRA